MALLLFICPANNANAAVSLATSFDAEAAENNGCEEAIDINADYAQKPFQNPEEWVSSDGLLKETLKVQYGEKKIGNCNVNLRSYNGELVGPTLRVKPGDTIKIKLINDLPPERSQTPSTIHEESPDCTYEEPTTANNTPHNFNTTNFHTHGLHVDPNKCSDNVLRLMKPKKEKEGKSPDYNIEVKIPENHPSGTFWYHAHLHGSTALQVSSGMAGALIVENPKRGLDKIPQIAAAKQKIFVFQQIAYDEDGQIENYNNMGSTAWKNGKWHTTVNGQIVPVIIMRPGEVQRWRFIHGGVRESINLELRDRLGRQIPLHEIAVDGIALGKLDSWKNAPIELEPGYRSDVLVKARPWWKISQEYYLVDRPTSSRILFPTGEAGHILAKVVVAMTPPLSMDLPDNEQMAEAKKKDAPPNISEEKIADEPQTLSFSISGGQFMVDGKPFSLNNVRELELGKAERWELKTDEQSVAPSHPFHIHVNPFQHDRLEPGQKECVWQDTWLGCLLCREPKTERIWRDTLMVKQGTPETILTRYDKFTGKFVLHCHILDHEDQGMMQLVQINKASQSGSE
ncbi:MAG: multicopper oxidase domain-containing protein [Oscillatoria sp. SIO1A7]|nr:multicopper oxidase domain-containing protein [Oscillatoria sp. SIO1A7]